MSIQIGENLYFPNRLIRWIVNRRKIVISDVTIKEISII